MARAGVGKTDVHGEKISMAKDTFELFSATFVRATGSL
jgi:hypothetical protein